MACIVKTSVFAKMDKKSIVQYLSQYSVNAPLKFKNELKKYIGIIAETPNIFSEYHANPNYRHLIIYGSYVLFYTVNEFDNTVFIYRILHSSQDIVNIL